MREKRTLGSLEDTCQAGHFWAMPTYLLGFLGVQRGGAVNWIVELGVGCAENLKDKSICDDSVRKFLSLVNILVIILFSFFIIIFIILRYIIVNY